VFFELLSNSISVPSPGLRPIEGRVGLVGKRLRGKSANRRGTGDTDAQCHEFVHFLRGRYGGIGHSLNQSGGHLDPTFCQRMGEEDEKLLAAVASDDVFRTFHDITQDLRDLDQDSSPT